MPDLESLAESLRRQRKDLAELMESTSSRSVETAELVGKIEDLRRRSEQTQRRFREAGIESHSPETR